MRCYYGVGLFGGAIPIGMGLEGRKVMEIESIGIEPIEGGFLFQVYFASDDKERIRAFESFGEGIKWLKVVFHLE